jgi:hypothetical protein
MLKLYKILSVDTFTATLINKKTRIFFSGSIKKKLEYGYIFFSGSIKIYILKCKKNIKSIENDVKIHESWV